MSAFSATFDWETDEEWQCKLQSMEHSFAAMTKQQKTQKIGEMKLVHLQELQIVLQCNQDDCTDHDWQSDEKWATSFDGMNFNRQHESHSMQLEIMKHMNQAYKETRIDNIDESKLNPDVQTSPTNNDTRRYACCYAYEQQMCISICHSGLIAMSTFVQIDSFDAAHIRHFISTLGIHTALYTLIWISHILCTHPYLQRYSRQSVDLDVHGRRIWLGQRCSMAK